MDVVKNYEIEGRLVKGTSDFPYSLMIGEAGKFKLNY